MPTHQLWAMVTESLLYNSTHNRKAKAKPQTHLMGNISDDCHQNRSKFVLAFVVHMRERLWHTPVWVDVDHIHLLNLSLCSHKQHLIA